MRRGIKTDDRTLENVEPQGGIHADAPAHNARRPLPTSEFMRGGISEVDPLITITPMVGQAWRQSPECPFERAAQGDLPTIIGSMHRSIKTGTWSVGVHTCHMHRRIKRAKASPARGISSINGIRKTLTTLCPREPTLVATQTHAHKNSS